MITNSVKINTDQNIAETFFKTSELFPNQIALKGNGGMGINYTYTEVQKLVKEAAQALINGTASESEEIGLLSENRPEWGIAYLATLAAGKTVVPIDANLKENEIEYIVKSSKLKSIFTSVRFESFLSKQLGLDILSFNEASPNYWLKNEGDKLYTPPDNFNETATLIFTSGTTGAPKAVELTHKNILSNIEGIYKALKFYSSDIFLSVLPLHHTFEATCGFLTPLMSGSTIVYARSLKSKEIMEDISKNNITIMIGVPQLFEKMYHALKRGIAKAPTGKKILFNLLYSSSAVGWKLGGRWGKPLLKKIRIKAGLGSLRMFVSGAAALPPSICRFYNYLGFDFFQGYGMTESSPVLTAQIPEDIVFGSVGPPIGGVEIKIKDPDEKGIGEIIAKGDNVTPGYRNNPEETANLIIDGWLHTGDLGRIIKGQLWITGRKKNIIVSAAGKNIYPEQIEEKLLESDFILESIVFGRKKKDGLAEEIMAIIVPDVELLAAAKNISVEKPDMEKIHAIFKEEIQNINSQMADYKRIKNFEVQLEELEKTSTKKVKRFIYK